MKTACSIDGKRMIHFVTAFWPSRTLIRLAGNKSGLDIHSRSRKQSLGCPNNQNTTRMFENPNGSVLPFPYYRLNLIYRVSYPLILYCEPERGCEQRSQAKNPCLRRRSSADIRRDRRPGGGIRRNTSTSSTGRGPGRRRCARAACRVTASSGLR